MYRNICGSVVLFAFHLHGAQSPRAIRIATPGAVSAHSNHSFPLVTLCTPQQVVAASNLCAGSANLHYPQDASQVFSTVP